MRTIDADALKIDYGFTWDDITPTHEEMYALIDRQPTIELEQRKGKWVKMTGMMPPEYHGHYECSECGWHLSHHDKTKENELGFCPSCGSYNGGGDEQND